MRPEEIRSELSLAGVKIGTIAKNMKVKHPAIYQVINRQRPNPRIRQAIAMAINKPVSEIWPEPSTEEKAA